MHRRSWYMGLDALRANGITEKVLFLLRDRSLTSPDDPLHKVRKSRIVLFTMIELIAFGATMAIVQTIGIPPLP
jgi:boron transporter